MRNYFYLIIFGLSLSCLTAEGQSSYFKLVPGSMSAQIKGKANDSLSLFYKCVYISKDSSTFNGIIYTNYITNKNGTPAIAHDSFNTAAQVPPITIHDSDTISFYCHIPVTPDYFKNGKANLVVIWPTGGRQSNKTLVYSADTFHYNTAITISGLSGIDQKEDPFGALNIYPNPANSYLNIRNTDAELVLNLIRIMDNNGRLVLQTKDNFDRIDISSLKPGTYYLELNSTDGNKAVYPFMVNR